jgi:hypothetical protein
LDETHLDIRVATEHCLEISIRLGSRERENITAHTGSYLTPGDQVSWSNSGSGNDRHLSNRISITRQSFAKKDRSRYSPSAANGQIKRGDVVLQRKQVTSTIGIWVG